MAIIAFWSDKKQDTAKTASIAAIATLTGLEHNVKSILTQTNFNDNSLESCFWDLNVANKSQSLFKSQNATSVIDNGIDALIKLLSSNQLVPEMITNYTKPVLKDRLEVLFGTNRPVEEYEKLKGLYPEIIVNANKYYDFVFVDLNKGTSDKIIKDVLSRADIIVVNISQGPGSIDRYIDYSKTNPELFSDYKTMILIGRYDEDSKYNTKNVSRYIGKKQAVCAIPYNTLFFEAIEESNVPDFLIKFRGVNEKDKNRTFIDSIRETIETILFKIEENKLNSRF